MSVAGSQAEDNSSVLILKVYPVDSSLFDDSKKRKSISIPVGDDQYIEFDEDNQELRTNITLQSAETAINAHYGNSTKPRELKASGDNGVTLLKYNFEQLKNPKQLQNASISNSGLLCVQSNETVQQIANETKIWHSKNGSLSTVVKLPEYVNIFDSKDITRKRSTKNGTIVHTNAFVLAAATERGLVCLTETSDDDNEDKIKDQESLPDYDYDDLRSQLASYDLTCSTEHSTITITLICLLQQKNQSANDDPADAKIEV